MVFIEKADDDAQTDTHKILYRTYIAFTKTRAKSCIKFVIFLDIV